MNNQGLYELIKVSKVATKVTRYELIRPLVPMIIKVSDLIKASTLQQRDTAPRESLSKCTTFYHITSVVMELCNRYTCSLCDAR